MSDREKNDTPCCISHAFLSEASQNPSKIAVIHASGGARVCRESRAKINSSDIDEEDLLFERSRVSSYPPIYQGDECFKYSDILAQVDSLSYRIRTVLDGGDDPDLIRPKGPNIKLDACMHKENASTEICGLANMCSSPHIVGIYIVPSVEYIISVLSILRCGAAFLPLDPSWPSDRILSTVSSSKVGLIIACSSSFDANHNWKLTKSDWWLEQVGSFVLPLSRSRDFKKHFGPSELDWPCESRNPRTFCYVMYTSGSTGRPKGICGTEEGLLNRFLWMQKLFPLDGADFLLFKTSISFIDHLQEFLSAIISGTTLIVPPFDDLKENPFYLVDFLKAYHVSRLTIVPSLLRAILPALQNSLLMQVAKFLQMLVLSGEVLHISLWDNLRNLFPETCILNIYGSTEVSGDCTYFECKNLSRILETTTLSSVPIGVPIFNCNVVLVGDGERNTLDEGELYVGGSCLSVGYLSDSFIMSSKSSDYVMLHKDSGLPDGRIRDHGSQLYFRTGDLARKLESGDFLFLGRKDRIVKVNGQRVGLEEIEHVLREHPDMVDAAVVAFTNGQGEVAYLGAYIVMRNTEKLCKEQCNHNQKKYVCEALSLSIRSWLVKKLQPAMTPSRYFFMESLPMSFSGKVDYDLLKSSSFGSKCVRDKIHNIQCNRRLLQVVKEAFCDALMVETVADDDDFFLMGGNSITAAQVAYKLGIDMRLLYIFPSPSKLLKSASLDRNESYEDEYGNTAVELVRNSSQELDEVKMRNLSKNNGDSIVISDSLKDSRLYTNSNATTSGDSSWVSCFCFPMSASFSRCNKVIYEKEFEVKKLSFSLEIPWNKNGHMQELWTVLLESCVDASPLVVLKDKEVYLFIGSHSHIFLCVNALSGLVRWEVKLEGRIECSAAITGDFTQIVVGCYKGKIYFLDYLSGGIFWAFQTGGEVKSQPVVDKDRSLVWCGSYDQYLYALNYKNYCCVSKISCGGSIYGSPCIDKADNKLYVASTSGLVTAVSTKALPFCVVWAYEAGAPIFGSLSVTPNRNVVCCLVDGRVIALNSSGSIIWNVMTGGPIFAGASISVALQSQILICSRNGRVYSFKLDDGSLLWEYNVGSPITSSAYIDENIQLISNPSHQPERLACVCSSSGSIHVLRIRPNGMVEKNKQEAPLVQKFASMDLSADIFSSPVMIGGHIFVGCRDDQVHCIKVFSSAAQ